MSIKIRCPKCGKELIVREEFAGRRGTCPDCKGAVDIPNVTPDSQQAVQRSHPEGSLPQQPPGHRAATLPPKPPLPPPPSVIPKSSAANPAGPVPYAQLVKSYPPYVEVPCIRDPTLAKVPELTQFQELSKGEKLIKSYRIRVRRPKLWSALAISLLFWFVLPVIPTLIVLGLHFVKRRGHTFLYLTTRRLIIVELEESAFGRSQTIMNYSISVISGFNLFTQRGVKMLLNLILLKEKRTFYISITTRTATAFVLGSENSMNSDYDPGQDAVSVCAELDALVLAIKADKL